MSTTETASSSVYVIDPEVYTTYTVLRGQLYLHYNSKDESENTLAGCGNTL